MLKHIKTSPRRIKNRSTHRDQLQYHMLSCSRSWCAHQLCQFQVVPSPHFQTKRLAKRLRKRSNDSKDIPHTFSWLSKDNWKGNTGRSLNDMFFLPSMCDVHYFEGGNLSTYRLSALAKKWDQSSTLRVGLRLITCPRLFCPAAQTLPLLPINKVWFLPHAADTNFVPGGAFISVGLTKRGAFSEMDSTSGTPRALKPLRPNNHAFPSMSSTTKWHPLHDVCTEVDFTFRSERSKYGSSRSGFLIV